MADSRKTNKRYTVLLVEDNPIDARLVGHMLEEINDPQFSLECVDRLGRAVERTSQGNFDAAIVDLSLPDSSGIDTFRNFHAAAPDLPVVVLTGLDDQQIALDSLQLGAQDYLIKGEINPKLLTRSLLYAMQRSRANSLESLNEQLQQTQLSLRTAIVDLKRKNKELDQFTYFASHDLQEPLRKVISFSELLVQDLGGNLNEQAQKDLDYITDAARRMQNLVQSLLDLSRTGRTSMEKQPVRLGECVARALDCLAPRLEESGAEVQRDPLPTVIGDATLLTQLYQNLIGNALKFTNRERPIVHLTAEKVAGDWILGVQDNGIGIEPEKSEEIFAPFQRLHGRDQYEGTGIGLSICHKVVQRHGGTIWVESEPASGAHFKFTLQELGKDQ